MRNLLCITASEYDFPFRFLLAVPVLELFSLHDSLPIKSNMLENIRAPAFAYTLCIAEPFTHKWLLQVHVVEMRGTHCAQKLV